MAQRDNRLDSGRIAVPAAGARAATPHRHEPRRALRRLRGSQRYLPLLITVAVVSTLGLAAITYVASRVNATTQAQTNALHDAAIARQLIADQGPGLSVSGGNLVVGIDNSVYTLNGETTLVDRARGLTGDDAAIYQLEGSQLVAIASNLPARGSDRALGELLTGAAFASLVGNCGALDSPTCHHAYSGLLTLHGIDYVVGFQPLLDSTGAFVGATGAAQPLSAVLAPVNQFAVVLLLVGLLLCFLCLVAGIWLIGSRSERMLATIDDRLDGVAEAAADLERLAHAQIARANARGRTARELNEHTRTLDSLATTMEDGQATFRESAGGIWNEMSQPGAAPDTLTTMRWAREAAVVSARMGTAAERARDVCQQLAALVNHILAENDVATDGGREMQYHARELRRSIDGVESALGERLIARPHGIAASPLVRRVRRWLPSRSLERPSRAANSASTTNKAPSTPPRNGPTGQPPTARRGPDAPEPLVSESLWLGTNRDVRTPTGQQRAPRPDDLSAQQPRLRPPSGPKRPSQPGQWGALRPSSPPSRTGQQPHIPSTPSAWTGDYPAVPRPRPPSDPTSRRAQPPHGPASSFGPAAQPNAFPWRPSSSPLNGLPSFDPNDPSRHDKRPNLDSHWPDE
jgi:hypothetical protein